MTPHAAFALQTLGLLRHKKALDFGCRGFLCAPVSARLSGWDRGGVRDEPPNLYNVRKISKLEILSNGKRLIVSSKSVGIVGM